MTPAPPPPPRAAAQRVSNIVFMGMGEPLLNLPSVLRAHDILNKEIGIGERPPVSFGWLPVSFEWLPVFQCCWSAGLGGLAARGPPAPPPPLCLPLTREGPFGVLPASPAASLAGASQGSLREQSSSAAEGGACEEQQASTRAASSGAALVPSPCVRASPTRPPAGARHITISTVGVPNAIRRMARLKMQSTLAVSIHAPNQVGGGRGGAQGRWELLRR